MNTRITIAAALLLGACSSDLSTPTPDNTADETLSTAVASTNLAAARVVTLAEFTGSYDATTGEFQMETVPFPAVDSDGYTTAQQELGFCNNFGINGPSPQFTMDTVAGSIGDTVADCIPGAEASAWGSLFYNDGGAFCATVRVGNSMSVTAGSVVAEITSITPGYEGYEYRVTPDGTPVCCGTGADTSGFADQNAPSDLAGGAFLHGDLAPTETADRQWTFRNGGGSFAFSGRIAAALTEVADGRDNDCDGRIDNGLGTYADSDPCRVGADCASGLCEDVDGDTGLGQCGSTCPPNTFGATCAACPSCGAGACDSGGTGSGECLCDEGFGGAACDECVSGNYGARCEHTCGDCGVNGACLDGIAGSGACECDDGFHGASCQFSCSDGIRNGAETRTDFGPVCIELNPLLNRIGGHAYWAQALDSSGIPVDHPIGGRRGDPTPAGHSYVDIDAGRDTIFCGLTTTGEIDCWGVRYYLPLPAAPAGHTFADVCAGQQHEVGLLDDGRVVFGGRASRNRTPIAAQTGYFTQVTCGLTFACALRSDGAAECWLNDGSRHASYAPSLQRPPAGTTFTNLASGERGTWGVLSNGTATYFGNSFSSVGTNGQRRTALSGGHFEQIDTFYGTAGAVRTDGTVEFWSGSLARSRVLRASPPGVTYTTLHTDVRGACAMRSDGDADCWGGRGNGSNPLPFLWRLR